MPESVDFGGESYDDALQCADLGERHGQQFPGIQLRWDFPVTCPNCGCDFVPYLRLAGWVDETVRDFLLKWADRVAFHGCDHNRLGSERQGASSASGERAGQLGEDYRLAYEALRELVLAEYPADRSVDDIAETWGEGITERQIDALRRVEE